jgi:5-methyltetrahydrofolate--homocysteine methyltransferase
MKTNRQHPLEKVLESRIAIIDGAMGTTIRTYGMTEADIRGERFKDSTKDLLNNGDLFSLTQPKMIGDIHRRFLEAGADIIETNTFGATSITQSEFFVDDPRERGGRKDPEFYQKIIDDPSSATSPGRSTRQSATPVPRVGRPRRQRNRASALRRGCDRTADRIAFELARRRRRRLPRGHLRPGEDCV